MPINKQISWSTGGYEWRQTTSLLYLYCHGPYLPLLDGEIPALLVALGGDDGQNFGCSIRLTWCFCHPFAAMGFYRIGLLSTRNLRGEKSFVCPKYSRFLNCYHDMPSHGLYMDEQRGWWDRIPDCCRGGSHSAEKVIGSLNPFVTEISIWENLSFALVQITVIYFSCLEMGKWHETNW